MARTTGSTKIVSPRAWCRMMCAFTVLTFSNYQDGSIYYTGYIVLYFFKPVWGRLVAWWQGEKGNN